MMIFDIHCGNTFNFFEWLQNPLPVASKAAALPAYIVAKEKKVSFNEIVNVREFEEFGPEDHIVNDQNPQALKAAAPALPAYIIVREKRVSFNEIVNVREFEKFDPEDDIVDDRQPPSTGSAMRNFDECKFVSSSDAFCNRETLSSRIRRNSIAFNHARRVLLHYQSYKDMGKKDTSLRVVSKQSSKPSSLKARMKAQLVAEEVNSSCSQTKLADSLFEKFGWNKRITDYYLDSFVHFLRVPNDSLCW